MPSTLAWVGVQAVLAREALLDGVERRGADVAVDDTQGRQPEHREAGAVPRSVWCGSVDRRRIRSRRGHAGPAVLSPFGPVDKGGDADETVRRHPPKVLREREGVRHALAVFGVGARAR